MEKHCFQITKLAMHSCKKVDQSWHSGNIAVWFLKKKMQREEEKIRKVVSCPKSLDTRWAANKFHTN